MTPEKLLNIYKDLNYYDKSCLLELLLHNDCLIFNEEHQTLDKASDTAFIHYSGIKLQITIRLYKPTEETPSQ